MAVVNRQSQAITNAQASPVVLNDPAKGSAHLREIASVIATAADDAANSIGRFARVPSNARISQIMISAADAATAGAVDIGLYDVAANGGAVVDADLFASAFDLALGPFNHQDVTFESGQYTYAEAEKMLWEVLGLSADPKKDYDVAYTITTTFNGGPTSIGFKVRFVQ